MTTVQTIRDRVNRRLIGETTPTIDRLDGAIDASVEAMTVEFSEPAIDRGSIVEIDTEQIYIVARTGTSVSSMVRGWNGTTAATHADNATIYVNPRFTNGQTVELIAEEIKSWPASLGKVVTDEVTFGAGDWIAEIPDDSEAGDIVRILDCKLLAESSNNHPRRDRIDVSLVKDLDADEYTSKFALQLPYTLGMERQVQVDYLVEYDLSAITTLSTNLETTVGVREELMDVLIYGTMWRAMSTLEMGRSETAAVPSLQIEAVPPTYMMQVAENLREVRDQRLAEEVSRMNGLYPTLMSTAQA